MRRSIGYRSVGRTLFGAALVIAVFATAFVTLFAHSIDYLASNVSPAATMNGQSGNWTVTNPVAGDSAVTFSVTFSINTQGNTANYPRTVTFGSETVSKPVGAADPVVAIQSPTATFNNSSSTHTTSVTVTAPATAGAYSVRIYATSGVSGNVGLTGGSGLVISFTVAAGPSEPQCANAATSLSVPEVCILYRQANATLSATLTSGGSAVSGKQISFTIDGEDYGTATTDASGIATRLINPSGLTVGNHTVGASFAGDCDYAPSTMSGNLGVSYVFTGFQQPINADGSSVFGGRTVPVKIKIADAYGQPVTDAEPYVFFAFGTPAIVGTDAEPLANTNADSGNLMRYDTTADQYVFNWDVVTLGGGNNGTYTVRVDLGEGSCGPPHLVTLSLKRKK